MSNPIANTVMAGIKSAAYLYETFTYILFVNKSLYFDPLRNSISDILYNCCFVNTPMYLSLSSLCKGDDPMSLKGMYL